MKRAAWVLGALILVVAAVVLVWPPAPPTPRTVDWQAHRREPTDSMRVVWVGHSLMNARDDHRPGAKNLLETVAGFAEARGETHVGLDHTLYGAPLSLLWRGEPHGYSRHEPQMREQRRALFSGEETYDAIVITEGIPVEASEELEHTPYYLQRFYCAFLERNPHGSVYLYESWVHLQASDPDAHYGPPNFWTWTDAVESSRAVWDRIADTAATGRVVGPDLEDYVKRFFGPTDGQCSHDAPIFTIPVASAMRALAIRLREPHPWTLGPRALSIGDLFLNPYVNWPPGWPTEDELGEDEIATALGALRRRYPNEELDDVHPSDLGVYFSALVTYATLYGKSPEGLPGPESMTGLSELQRFVWEHVRADPRTGVR